MVADDAKARLWKLAGFLPGQDAWNDDTERLFMEKWGMLIDGLPDPPLLERDATYRLKVRWGKWRR